MDASMGHDTFMGNQDTDSLFGDFESPYPEISSPSESPVTSVNTVQVNQDSTPSKKSSLPSLVEWNPAYAGVQQPPPSPVLLEHPLSPVAVTPEPSTDSGSEQSNWSTNGSPRPTSSSSSGTSFSSASAPSKKKGGRRGKKSSDQDPLKPNGTKVAKKTLRKDSCEPCRASHTPCHVSPGNVACQSCLDKGRDCVYGADGRTTRDNVAKLEHQANYIIDITHKWHCVLLFLATDSDSNDATRESQVQDILVDLKHDGPSACYAAMENHRFPAAYRPVLMTSPRDTTDKWHPDCVKKANRVLAGGPRLADLRKAQKAFADGALAYLETLWRIMSDIRSVPELGAFFKERLQFLDFALSGGKCLDRLAAKNIHLRPLESQQHQVLNDVRKHLKDDRFCAQFGKQDFFQPQPPTPLPAKPAKVAHHAAAAASASPAPAPAQAFAQAPMPSVAPAVVPALNPAPAPAPAPASLLAPADLPVQPRGDLSTQAAAQSLPAPHTAPLGVFFNQLPAATQIWQQPPVSMFQFVEQLQQPQQPQQQDMDMSFDFTETLDDDNINTDAAAANNNNNTDDTVQEPMVIDVDAADVEMFQLLQQVIAEEEANNNGDGSISSQALEEAAPMMVDSEPLATTQAEPMVLSSPPPTTEAEPMALSSPSTEAEPMILSSPLTPEELATSGQLPSEEEMTTTLSRRRPIEYDMMMPSAPLVMEEMMMYSEPLTQEENQDLFGGMVRSIFDDEFIM